MKTNDPIVWTGNDERFDLMVAATERAPTFNQWDWGAEVDEVHQCGTAACLAGNYWAAAYPECNGEYRIKSSALSSEFNITDWEANYLFSTTYTKYHPTKPYVKKPKEKEPNLNRLKKYLAWKRRKADRIALDEAMQQADRELLRRQQAEKRKAVTV
jgi:hypothetical protein